MTSTPLKTNSVLYEQETLSPFQLVGNNDLPRNQIHSCYDLIEAQSSSRSRSSAFVEQSTDDEVRPLSVNSQIVGFTVNSSATNGQVIDKHNDGSDDQQKLCHNCILAQNALLVSFNKNEELIKSLSRIITRIKEALEMVSMIDSVVTKQRERSRTPDAMFEDGKAAFTSPTPPNKQDEPDITHLVAGMFPGCGTEMDDLLTQLHESLKETKEMCLSSADTCFEDSTLLRSVQAIPHPSLARMKTISGGSSSQLCDSSVGHEAIHHLQRLSETTPNDKTSSLRRTHSETELTSSNMSSKVLTMESLTAPPPIPAKKSKAWV